MINPSKSLILRRFLSGDTPIVVAGAHDAISAKLIEEAGFEGVWASGFGISAAQKCLPDANYMTMTENLEVAKNMNEAVGIPIIADCDNGYGNALNVMRTVEVYEQAGIAAICIEDNIFPKRCSFYPGFRRELVSVDEMEGRIRAGKAAQRTPEFVLIARTEALIAGWGMEEALQRGERYADAGADAVLIHSKSKDPDEILQFARSWKSRVPLVVVPTVFDSITVPELFQAGFRIIIFANQAIRTCISSMRTMLSELRSTACAAKVRPHLATLEQVYELVGVKKMKEDEERFLPVGADDTRAVIVSAGFEEHLMPLIEDRPKSMLDIKGKTILERQVEVLNACNVKHIAVVRGYRGNSIRLPNLVYYDNTSFKESYILHSFFCAEPELRGRVLFLYGDILFERPVLEKLLQSGADISIAVDRAWCDAHQQGRVPAGVQRELVVMKEPPQTAYRYIPSGANHAVLSIGQKVDPVRAHGEFIGMAMFSAKGIDTLKREYERLVGNGAQGAFQESASLKMASLTDMLQELIDRGQPVTAVDIYKGWMEIDTFEDYQRAWAQIN